MDGLVVVGSSYITHTHTHTTKWVLVTPQQQQSIESEKRPPSQATQARSVVSEPSSSMPWPRPQSCHAAQLFWLGSAVNVPSAQYSQVWSVDLVPTACSRACLVVAVIWAVSQDAVQAKGPRDPLPRAVAEPPVLEAVVDVCQTVVFTSSRPVVHLGRGSVVVHLEQFG